MARLFRMNPGHHGSLRPNITRPGSAVAAPGDEGWWVCCGRLSLEAPGVGSRQETLRRLHNFALYVKRSGVLYTRAVPIHTVFSSSKWKLRFFSPIVWRGAGARPNRGHAAGFLAAREQAKRAGPGPCTTQSMGSRNGSRGIPENPRQDFFSILISRITWQSARNLSVICWRNPRSSAIIVRAETLVLQ